MWLESPSGLTEKLCTSTSLHNRHPSGGQHRPAHQDEGCSSLLISYCARKNLSRAVCSRDVTCQELVLYVTLLKTKQTYTATTREFREMTSRTAKCEKQREPRAERSRPVRQIGAMRKSSTSPRPSRQRGSDSSLILALPQLPYGLTIAFNLLCVLSHLGLNGSLVYP